MAFHIEKQTNKVLVDALVNALKDSKTRIKNSTLESICAAHLHNDLRHEILVRLHGCNRKEATRILTVLNELVPRDNNKGETDMAAKKTAKKTPAKKTVAKPAAKKAKEQKATQVKKNGIAQPREGTTTRKVWNLLDAMKKKNRTVPTRKEATAELAPKGLHRGTIGVQYRNWAIFNDCYAKAPKAKAPAKKRQPPTKKAVKRPVAKKVKK